MLGPFTVLFFVIPFKVQVWTFNRMVLPYRLTHLPSTDLNRKILFQRHLFLQHASSTYCSFHRTVLQATKTSSFILGIVLSWWDTHLSPKLNLKSFDCCSVFSAQPSHHSPPQTQPCRPYKKYDCVWNIVRVFINRFDWCHIHRTACGHCCWVRTGISYI